METSVVIPAYNAERTLARAVESVLNQTRLPLEVIVVDDGSTDNTPEVAGGFRHPVRCIRQDNSGASAARNRGIQAASGEWVAFLDADDWWKPNRLEWALDIARRHPGLQWVAGRYIHLWSNGTRIIDPESPAYLKLLSDDHEVFPDYYEAACAGVQFSTITMLVRRMALTETGLFDPRLKVAEDTDLWCRMADQAPAIGYVNAPIAVYDRCTERSLTKNRLSYSEDLWGFLSKHIQPGVGPRGGAARARERFFGSQVSRALRHAMRLGETASTRRILTAYSPWLPMPYRLAGRFTASLPSILVKSLGRIYRAVNPPRSAGGARC